MPEVENVSLNKEKTVVTVHWQDGHQSRWDAVLLRLYCQCDQCKGKIQMNSLRDDMLIQSVEIEGKKILVEITNDVFPKHVTMLGCDWLRRNCYCDSCLSSAISRREPSHFDPQTNPIPSVNYQKILENKDEGLFEVADKVLKTGFCVVKHAPCEDEISIRVAEMFGPIHETVTDRMFDIRIQSGPRNTSHTALGLVYHQDLPWYETEPGVQYLHALKFDDDIKGGESQLVDLLNVAEILRKEDVEAFNDLTRIPATFETIDYVRAKPAHYETLKSHIELDYFGNIVAVHWNPGVEGTLRARGDDIDKYYKAYNKFLAIVRRPELEWQFRLEAGDVVIFNNHRMVHARKGFTSVNGGQRHLQGCFTTLDDFRSTYITTGELLNKDVALLKIGNKSSF